MGRETDKTKSETKLGAVKLIWREEEGGRKREKNDNKMEN
jgi:hypothetical protein